MRPRRIPTRIALQNHFRLNVKSSSVSMSTRAEMGIRLLSCMDTSVLIGPKKPGYQAVAGQIKKGEAFHSSLAGPWLARKSLLRVRSKPRFKVNRVRANSIMSLTSRPVSRTWTLVDDCSVDISNISAQSQFSKELILQKTRSTSGSHWGVKLCLSKTEFTHRHLLTYLT